MVEEAEMVICAGRDVAYNLAAAAIFGAGIPVIWAVFSGVNPRTYSLYVSNPWAKR